MTLKNSEVGLRAWDCVILLMVLLSLGVFGWQGLKTNPTVAPKAAKAVHDSASWVRNETQQTQANLQQETKKVPFLLNHAAEQFKSDLKEASKTIRPAFAPSENPDTSDVVGSMGETVKRGAPVEAVQDFHRPQMSEKLGPEKDSAKMPSLESCVEQHSTKLQDQDAERAVAAQNLKDVATRLKTRHNAADTWAVNQIIERSLRFYQGREGHQAQIPRQNCRP